MCAQNVYLSYYRLNYLHSERQAKSYKYSCIDLLLFDFYVNCSGLLILKTVVFHHQVLI